MLDTQEWHRMITILHYTECHKSDCEMPAKNQIASAVHILDDLKKYEQKQVILSFLCVTFAVADDCQHAKGILG